VCGGGKQAEQTALSRSSRLIASAQHSKRPPQSRQRKRNLTIRLIPVPLLLGTVAFIAQKRRDKQVPNLKPQGLRLRLIGMTLAGS
jgi:hypothetical protein